MPRFRFQLYYYSDPEVKKDESSRKETVLTIDTRGLSSNGGGGGGGGIAADDNDQDLDDAPTPAMELLIKTK